MRGTDITFKITYNKTNCILLSVLDTVLSAVVIAPAVVGYWRGTWNLSDYYLFKDNEKISIVLSLILGFIGQLVFTHAQDCLARNLTPSKSRFIFYMGSRLYTYIFGVACIHLWRGIWKTLEYYSGLEIINICISTIISIVFLIVTRTFRNISAIPFIVAVDLPQGYFAVPTMFKLTDEKVNSLVVLDYLFSVFVVSSLVVISWRGVWVLFDIFLYPENEKLSTAISLTAGYAIVFFVFSIQKFIKRRFEKLQGFWRLMALNSYVFLAFVGTINVWRGVWNSLNIYFLPESPVASWWLTHFGCFAFLILINCSNSALVRGVAVDETELEKKNTIFPISYIISFVKDEEGMKQEQSQNVERGVTAEIKRGHEEDRRTTDQEKDGISINLQAIKTSNHDH